MSPDAPWRLHNSFNCEWTVNSKFYREDTLILLSPAESRSPCVVSVATQSHADATTIGSQTRRISTAATGMQVVPSVQEAECQTDMHVRPCDVLTCYAPGTTMRVNSVCNF